MAADEIFEGASQMTPPVVEPGAMDDPIEPEPIPAPPAPVTPAAPGPNGFPAGAITTDGVLLTLGAKVYSPSNRPLWVGAESLENEFGEEDATAAETCRYFP